MKKFVQEYVLHLINGEKIIASEDYDSDNTTIPEMILKADDNKIFMIGDPIIGYAYVPKKSVVYITQGDVKEALVIEMKGMV